MMDSKLASESKLGSLGTLMPQSSAEHAGRDSLLLGLVVAAQGGDRSAFGELHRLYARMVHGILLSLVPSREADDLVQDVFLMALKNLARLRDAATFGAWLAMIARNRAHDFRRRRRSPEALPDEIPERASWSVEAAEVLGVVRTLPEAYRETLVMRLVEGMSGPEIAQRTGLTPASVRVNLHRGMKQLRARLGGACEDECGAEDRA
jgi:RNA polymerase sigma-70 factor (ECF subfamily)